MISTNTESISYERAQRVFLDFCEMKNLSDNTVRWYDNRLRAMKRFFDADYPGLTPAETTIAQLRALISSLSEKIAPKTINHTVTALKTFFTFLEEEGYIEDNPAKRLIKVKAPRTLIQPFSPDQVAALIEAPDKGRFSGMRDYTLLLLLLDTGLRISEALGLKLDDIDWQSNTAKVMGKGAKERIVPFGRAVRKALKDYLPRRGQPGNDWLFVGEMGDKLCTRTIEDNMRNYGEKAKITGVRCSPHTCRHFAAVTYLRNGGSVFHLQKLLGHSSLEICRIYLNLADDDMLQSHAAHSPLDNLLSGKSGQVFVGGRKRLR